MHTIPTVHIQGAYAEVCMCVFVCVRCDDVAHGAPWGTYLESHKLGKTTHRNCAVDYRHRSTSFYGQRCYLNLHLKTHCEHATLSGHSVHAPAGFFVCVEFYIMHICLTVCCVMRLPKICHECALKRFSKPHQNRAKCNLFTHSSAWAVLYSVLKYYLTAL